MQLIKKATLAFIGMVLIGIAVGIQIPIDMGLASFDTLTIVVQEIFEINNFGNAAFLIHAFIALVMGSYFFKEKKPLYPIVVSMISIFILTRIINAFSFISEFEIIYVSPLASFIVSIIIVSLGVYIMGKANLIIPPYDKVPVEISNTTKFEVGKVRLVLDTIILIISLIFGTLTNSLPSITLGTFLLTFGLGFFMYVFDMIYQKVKNKFVKY